MITDAALAPAARRFACRPRGPHPSALWYHDRATARPTLLRRGASGKPACRLPSGLGADEGRERGTDRHPTAQDVGHHRPQRVRDRACRAVASARCSSCRVGASTIGRSLEADIRLEDEGVSRLHLRLDRSDDGAGRAASISTRPTAATSTAIACTASSSRTATASSSARSPSSSSATRTRSRSSSSSSSTSRQRATRSPSRTTSASSTSSSARTSATRNATSSRCRCSASTSITSSGSTTSTATPAGDHVLQRLAACIMGSLRTEDAFCRVGGEEFAVIARDCPMSEALQLAERIRKLVAGTRFVYDGVALPVTISIGVSSYDPGRHRRPAAPWSRRPTARCTRPSTPGATRGASRQVGHRRGPCRTP